MGNTKLRGDGKTEETQEHGNGYTKVISASPIISQNPFAVAHRQPHDASNVEERRTLAERLHIIKRERIEDTQEYMTHEQQKELRALSLLAVFVSGVVGLSAYVTVVALQAYDIVPAVLAAFLTIDMAVLVGVLGLYRKDIKKYGA